MIRLENVHSITELQRNPRALLEKLKETKLPSAITVNGKSEFVIQDAISYQELVDLVSLQRGYIDSLLGNTEEASVVFARIEEKHGLRHRDRAAS